MNYLMLIFFFVFNNNDETNCFYARSRFLGYYL